jgi:hypothetical protein
LIAATWPRTSSPARSVALRWSIAAVVIVFALGKPSPHYFLAVYAPLVMLLFSGQFELRLFVRRWYYAAAAVGCAVVMVSAEIHELRAPFFGSAGAMERTGAIVRQTFGPAAIGVMPWEIYLTSDARPPNRFFLASGSVNFARLRDRWLRRPVVLIDAADLRFNKLPPPRDLPIACTSDRIAPYVLHTAAPIGGLACVRS